MFRLSRTSKVLDFQDFIFIDLYLQLLDNFAYSRISSSFSTCFTSNGCYCIFISSSFSTCFTSNGCYCICSSSLSTCFTSNGCSCIFISSSFLTCFTSDGCYCICISSSFATCFTSDGCYCICCSSSCSMVDLTIIFTLVTLLKYFKFVVDMDGRKTIFSWIYPHDV